MKSVIIIGKGPSVLKSKRNWVESFKEAAMINAVPFEGYEEHIGNKAAWWFRNWSCTWYPDEYLQSLELKYVVNTTNKMHSGSKRSSFPDLFPRHITCLFPNYFDDIKKKHQFDPTSGLVAFEYFVRENYQKIGMVGIDLYTVGINRYFHEEQMQEVPSLHDMGKTLEYMNKTMKDNPQIKFEILSYANFNDLPNVKIVEF